MKRSNKLIFNIVLIAIFAALEFVLTAFVAIPIGLGGYLNFSDFFVFILASLFNPIIGGLVGGIAASLSDIYLGYMFFAPFTFVIKFLEGLLAGYLYRFIFKKSTKYGFLYLKGILSFEIGAILMATLYMIPDYVSFVFIPNSEMTFEILYVDLLLNFIQGTINAILASIFILPLNNVLMKNINYKNENDISK